MFVAQKLSLAGLTMLGSSSSFQSYSRLSQVPPKAEPLGITAHHVIQPNVSRHWRKPNHDYYNNNNNNDDRLTAFDPGQLG